MKRNPFAVVFSKMVFGGGWNPRTLTRRRTEAGARLFAAVIGNRYPDLQVTRRTYHRRRSTIEVVGPGRRIVWEHPGVIVPSVGDMGCW